MATQTLPTPQGSGAVVVNSVAAPVVAPAALKSRRHMRGSF